jgi:hypothetical protein
MDISGMDSIERKKPGGHNLPDLASSAKAAKLAGFSSRQTADDLGLRPDLADVSKTSVLLVVSSDRFGSNRSRRRRGRRSQ